MNDKKILKISVIGFALGLAEFFFVGGVLHDTLNHRTSTVKAFATLGQYIMIFSGIIFTIILLKIIYVLKIHPIVKQKLRERNKNKIENELLRLRKLYDAEIIEKEEFHQKVKELKKKIL